MASRIGEIQYSSKPSRVTTQENPADPPTTGAAVARLKQSEMSWQVPTFLSKDQGTWPKTKTDPSPEAAMEVRKKIKTTVEPVQESTLSALMTETPSRLQPSRFPSWRKLVRFREWVGRFVNNCRIHINERSYGGLACQEIADAEIEITKKVQQEAFHEYYKTLGEQKALPSNSKLLSLKLVLDEDGLLRSDSRLSYADYLPFDARFPVILLRKNSVTRLIVKSFHEGINNSAGTNHTLSLLSS